MFLGQKTTLAVADQGVVSGANFGANLALIRWGTPTEYGLFVVAQAVLLFVVGIHGALITTPMTVTLPREKSEHRGQWFLPLVIGPSLVPGVIALVAVFVLSGIADWEPGLMQLAMVASVASIAVLLREFMRAWFYSALQPATVLVMDIAYAAFLLGGIWLLMLNAPLTASGMVGSLGFAAAVVSFFSLVMTLRHLGSGQIPAWRSCLRLMKLGRWGVLGSIVTWCQTQSYVYLLMAFVGASATATASASRIFFSPLALFASGWGAIYKPWGARIPENDPEGLRVPMVEATSRLTILSAIYGVVVVAAHVPLVEHVLGENYRGIGSIDLVFWAIYFSVLTIRSGITNTLQVMQQFRALFFCCVGGAAASVLASTPLIIHFGVHGSLIGLIIGEVVLTLLALRHLASVWNKPGWIRWLFIETARP